jgi:hypothetical protein
MMPLPGLLGIPTNPTAFNEFLFWNASDHQEIITAIEKQKGINLPVYDLLTFDPADPRGWLERHSQSHNDMDLVLKVAGNDLLSVDFRDERQVQGWIYLQYQEHLQARTILGI